VALFLISKGVCHLVEAGGLGRGFYGSTSNKFLVVVELRRRTIFLFGSHLAQIGLKALSGNQGI